ncbi:MAG: hypothetical protein ACEQSB_00255 [Undibacterium sp.]
MPSTETYDPDLEEDAEALAEAEKESAASKTKVEKRLTPEEWLEIKEYYELGKMNMSALAAKYEVSRQNLFRRFKSEGLVAGSRSHELSSAIAAATINSTVATAVAAERYVDNRIAWIEESRLAGYKVLKMVEQLTRRELMENLKAGKKVSDADDAIRVIQRFQDVFILNTKSRLDILKSDEIIDQDDLPSLMIEDLTNDDVIEHYRLNGMLDDVDDPENLLTDIGKLDFDT